MFKTSILLLLWFAEYSFAANILFVCPVASPSHHIWNEALVEGLLQNDHNITMLGFYAPTTNSQNYNILRIDVTKFDEMMGDLISDVTIEGSSLGGLFTMDWVLIEECKFLFEANALMDLLKYPSVFFDVIVFDITFAHCLYPLIDHFSNAPVVGITPFGMQPYLDDMVGQRTENYSPYFALPYTDEMNIFQRISNIIHQKYEVVCKWWYMKKVRPLIEEYFKRPIPNLEVYENKFSLMFSNDDPILDYPKAFAPNVIPIGGVHVRKPKKLDDELQKIMDESTNGVIFVSMGTNFNPQYYSEDAKKSFIEAFAKVNLTVLWKFDKIDAPKNVITRKWFSQSDILAHPNTKLFITHCGGLSSHETIVRGIPVVGVPLFADQHYKAAKFKSIKGGVVLKYLELTTENIFNAINEVLYNSEYKKNMVKLSTLYHSQPQQPIEKFLLWMEYIIKNGDLVHLSIANRNMKWYQVDNWDICALSCAIIIFIIVLLRKLCCVIKTKFCNTNRKEKMH